MAAELPFEPVVATFARHGYRKTAMDDVAAALGVSRQLLYNRFGSKKALADWARASLVAASLAAALDAIEQPAKTLPDRLADALDKWVGRHMDALNASPFGADAVPISRNYQRRDNENSNNQNRACLGFKPPFSLVFGMCKRSGRYYRHG